jgi:hypothetical protein
VVFGLWNCLVETIQQPDKVLVSVWHRHSGWDFKPISYIIWCWLYRVKRLWFQKQGAQIFHISWLNRPWSILIRFFQSFRRNPFVKGDCLLIWTIRKSGGSHALSLIGFLKSCEKPDTLSRRRPRKTHAPKQLWESLNALISPNRPITPDSSVRQLPL